MCKYNENIYKKVDMIKSNQTGITELKVQYMKWTNSLEAFNTRFERTKEKQNQWTWKLDNRDHLWGTGKKKKWTKIKE